MERFKAHGDFSLNHYFENNNEPILKNNKPAEKSKDNNDETVKRIFRCSRHQNKTSRS